MANVLPRNKIDNKYKCNAESVFANPEAWEAEVKSILESLPALAKYKGHLGDNAAALADGLKAIDDISLRAYRAFVYAIFSYQVETTNQKAAAMAGKAQGMGGQVRAAVSFLDPELIALGESKLNQWMKDEPRLAIYKQYAHNLFRKQAHVRSSEVEELLGMLSEPFAGPTNSTSMLSNADFKFPQARDSKGKKHDVTHGTIGKIFAGADRKARQTAWASYMDKHLEYKNTLATNLASSISQNVFQMRARKHNSTLAASLHENNIPIEVFHNLIDVFKKNLPTWHKYWDIRRKGLGVKELDPFDIWAPLTKKKFKLPYTQAVDLICEGLAPMGDDYVKVLRQGCLEDRWVDIYPNMGKGQGSFSWGAPGTHPFIMMSYTDEIGGMSTLAHELGHSMHSYLTWKNQPLVYSEYSLFAAEVASNFHQAMVRAHLLQKNKDKNFQIAMIGEAMDNLHRYFFIMPTLARFELETHTRAEKGEPLTADALIKLMADLFEEGYGGKMKVERERVGITWATFQHLFSDYYVYQYATGISGAHAIANRILRKEPNAVEDYLKFLKACSSMYPLDSLKMAGVDLSIPKPVEETFAVLAEYVDRLETLVK